VLEKSGIAWRVNTADPAEQPTVFLDVTSRLLQGLTVEEGLLGLAFAPDFATSGSIYVHYTAPGETPVNPGGIPRKSVIARFHASATAADPSTEQRLIELPDPYSNHNGGALEFGPDGMLYISIGDGGAAGDPQGRAQNLGVLFGKILRIDVSGDTYTIPPDNPFVGVPNARPEVWAYGLRNPWRITFDSTTGELWAGDVGQGMWEEVDVIVRGGNYGWNELEGYHCYNADVCGGAQTVQPVAEYSHNFGCAITGGFVYRGTAMPELQGWYIYGDFCSGRVWGVNADGNRTNPFPLADTGLQISSFAQDPAGEIYIVTFDRKVVRLVRK
jgi:glucose/arabinose dehydrogenase